LILLLFLPSMMMLCFLFVFKVINKSSLWFGGRMFICRVYPIFGSFLNLPFSSWVESISMNACFFN
jgi:hypothetical protein